MHGFGAHIIAKRPRFAILSSFLPDVLMFRRKLTALGYHSPNGDIPLGKPEDLKPLVVWLEDRKICSYKIENRKPLREEEGGKWVEIFKSYLKALECPFTVESGLATVVDWLLGVAVRYEFKEMAESNPELRCGVGGAEGEAEAATPPGLSRKLLQSAGPPNDPLDIDPVDPMFVSGTQALAKILGISPHPDPSILLEAIRIVIQEKLSKPALEQSSKSTKEDKKYTITAKECGFDLGDPVLSEAAKVLRLLHIQELRDLQTSINELIVAVQAITANPKTDQSLGQVGR